MPGSQKGCMRLGISTSVFSDRPIFEVLPLIAKEKFEVVEIWSSPDSQLQYTHFDVQNLKELKELKTQLAAFNLKAISLHSPFYPSFDLSHPDPSIQEQSINVTVAAAKALKEIGGEILVVHPSGVEKNQFSELTEENKRLELIRKNIGIIYQYTHKLGVILALETLLPQFLGSNLDFLFHLVSSFPEDVGICFDTGHVLLNHQADIDIQYKKIAKRVVSLHIQDTLGQQDDHLVPGDGIINWQNFIEALKEEKFKGDFLLEINGLSFKDNPEALLQKARLQSLEKIKGKIEKDP
ncbi:sugar phosphate isomerase/epimerase [Methylacidiphilum kamchatkense Kam1]|uniref:Sugar phosphate isomerase/epimerase n=2 Tax=Methylacidiphilum kamchatkense Kam1 TaxID=1202785 RepID=A0A516TLT6_9BACT|nr:sugar phosphate isomerase/epimerase [Methylacidiphilum kamchatkense Kam1]